MAQERIKPRNLRGFQDFLPAAAQARQRIVDTFRKAFELYGFAPLETPALETEEVLLSDMGVDANKQIYRFSDLENVRVGLRYDFTVSLARTVAANLNRISLPFKRYQVGPVWRYDKPKRGRYREFTQIDLDIIGVAPYEPEVEMVAAVGRGLKDLGAENYIFRVNDRRYLGDLLERLGVAPEKGKDVFRVLDKLQKQGEKKVRDELTGKLLLQDFASALEFERMQEVAIPEGAADGLLAAIKDTSGLREYLGGFLARIGQEGVGGDNLVADPSLTRGLDYYTGFVCEVDIKGAEALGSVGGGGRYDDLLGRYSATPLTGVGMSVGLDRLADALAATGILEADAGQSSARVFVAVFDDSLRAECATIARTLREAGVPTEMWLAGGNRNGRTLSKQFKYADKVGIPLAVVAGEDELAKDPPRVQLKDLRTGYGQEGKQNEIPRDELVARAKELLGWK
ncbi:histidine--tRNA ligase [bacterium]|nr:histidine--tRNA ligase [bacterium]